MTSAAKSSLVTTGAKPLVVLVSSSTLLPRFWATAWSVGLAGKSLAINTLKLRLRHIGAFYAFCDESFGDGSLDAVISSRDVPILRRMVEAFYLQLTAAESYTSTTVQRWDAVRVFIPDVLQQMSSGMDELYLLSTAIQSMGRIREPQRGGFKFARALPGFTLRDLLVVANPVSPRNPFKDYRVRWRNWLIVYLFLLVGLRRGELLLLSIDSLKQDVDSETGEWVRWLDVTTTEYEDRRATRPSIKTAESHRQVPISEDLAALYERYVAEFRESSDDHAFLLTARGGTPLSAESVNKMLEELTAALGDKAAKRFKQRTGGKQHVSPHDLRHTCATARYRSFIQHQPDRELALQRMRAFFGWSVKSTMPDLYARAAIQDDLVQTWNTLFDEKVRVLRGGRP